MLSIPSMCCISRPGVMPCCLSVIFFFQLSSQTPLPSSDKCREMKIKNALVYSWRHSLVIANVFPCVCHTKANFQLFYQKYPLPPCSCGFCSEDPNPAGNCFPPTTKLKDFLSTKPYYSPLQPQIAGHIPIKTGQNSL